MIDFEVTIIGAGIIGLSIARELSQNGRNVLIIEKNKSFGEENSSRNSGVIHAGVYYKNKTLTSSNILNKNLNKKFSIIYFEIIATIVINLLIIPELRSLNNFIYFTQ